MPVKAAFDGAQLLVGEARVLDLPDSALGRDLAKVTIKEATAKKPGTIALTAYGDGAEDAAVANVKAPSVKGIAGDTVWLTFARTGGADGKVAVKVASRVLKTDTAKAGTDYKAFAQTLTWEDGDAEPKQVEVTLPSVKGYTATKKFTFTMAAVKTGTTPALAAKAGTFTISNATVAQTAAAYAKKIAASTGHQGDVVQRPGRHAAQRERRRIAHLHADGPRLLRVRAEGRDRGRCRAACL